MTSDANGTYRGVYTYGLERIAERDLAAVEGVPNDPLYYLYDGKGSVTQLVNTENHVRDKYRYTPFGVPMPGGQLTPNTRLFNNPYGYNGEDYDIESGLQFLRARYYNTETARFISRDSYLGDVMEPLSLNRYAYTSNNPVMNIDPSGHMEEYSGEKENYTEEERDRQKEYLLGLSNSSTSNKPILKMGSSGSDVAEVQQILKNQGYDLGSSGVDGIYGKHTHNAVKAYQVNKGLQVDGEVGPETWKSLSNYANGKAGESKANSKNDTACADVGGGFVEGNGIQEVSKRNEFSYIQLNTNNIRPQVLQLIDHYINRIQTMSDTDMYWEPLYKVNVKWSIEDYENALDNLLEDLTSPTGAKIENILNRAQGTISGSLQFVGGISEAGMGSAIATSGSLTGIGIPIGIAGGYIAIDGASNITGGASKVYNALFGENVGDTLNFMKNAYNAISPEYGEDIYNITQLGIGLLSVGKGLVELPQNSVSVYARPKNIARANTEGLSTKTIAVDIGDNIVLTTKTDSGMILQKTIIDKSKLTNGTLFIGFDIYGTNSTAESINDKYIEREKR